MAEIEIEINGQKITAATNETVIQAADRAGVYIPRFCYHKHLSIAANCRMCLVEVEKSPKALPACATPVAPGMKVFTKSQKSIDAQRAVMEFLLINHPLDCPICDQGGECELQDLSMGYGSSHSRYDETKRAVADQNLGPLIATEMTRCIHCTRCVRFGDEIAGLRELGITFRGEHAEIGTYVEHAMQSEVSGNIIDLCPVGALTSKPYRFTARAWELIQTDSIAPHDCIGANIHVHALNGVVKRVVPRENEAVNEVWISDRDRFAYTGLYSKDRLEEPAAKIDGKWQAIEWQKAFEIIADNVHDVIAEHGADKIGALASPNATLEEYFLLQKIMRELGSPHIDHRLREIDTSDQADFSPGLHCPLSSLETLDAVLLIGSNIQKEQPSASLRIRKAVLKGALVCAVNPVDYRFHFKIAHKKIAAPHEIPIVLSALVNALGGQEEKIVEADDAISQIAKTLMGKKNSVILLGASAMHHPNAAWIRYLASEIARLTNAKIGFLTNGANSMGAHLAGAVPHRHAGCGVINQPGFSAYDMLSKARKAYLLLNVEPDLDCANSAHAIAVLKQAQFVAAFSMYRNPILETHAHVILPIASFAETSGTFVNAEGRWQSFKGAANAFRSSRPAWKILRVLGQFLELDHFEYESSEDILREVKKLVDETPSVPLKLNRPSLPFPVQKEVISRIGDVPIYAVDGLVRRSKPLQIAQEKVEGDVKSVRLHPETAKDLGIETDTRVKISQQGGSCELNVKLDAYIAKNAVWVASGIAETVGLGDLFGEVEIRKV